MQVLYQGSACHGQEKAGIIEIKLIADICETHHRSSFYAYLHTEIYHHFRCLAIGDRKHVMLSNGIVFSESCLKTMFDRSPMLSQFKSKLH
ncbi:hypothetical protein EmuJ_000545200 [Echinococcus multilocularis]|uniref:Uncharacterized protein n=1 Tax=Echinococcus multilocularis TaxID=6211 RepID=A0A068Y751_ECHMU|nr:hypothetical protein EmuJ_000545200 [Echinococcus multilocularis]